MAKPRTDLRALRNVISEADLILTTTALPEGRAERCRELFKAAVALADHLLASPAAATLGRKDGLHWHFILGTVVSPGPGPSDVARDARNGGVACRPHMDPQGSLG